jgi:class 3 adenylate cyclase/tetratricopeptide (TPR) repeat protein
VTVSAHRKVVTVLFCDVVDSTALGESVDPEALQGLLARYFEQMKAIVESHGGSVEKFIGDAVMAVFGVPVAHEDDALRGCRAAVEMRDALPELGVEGRIGINTGEVLTGTEERLATGDAVNVAARLEQAAEPGEVLIGAETLGLVAPTVEVGEKRLLELKGKSEPVAAHPLVTVHEAAERSHSSRFVGRGRELQQLVDAWDRALAGPRCELVTVVGDPGVGKSRLVAEALAQIDARIVRGRCLSYGEGITYWPVVEIVKQLDAVPSDEQAASAIRSLLRENDTAAGTDEIGWAFRKLLEEQAPLVVCFDDIQWGEETFLDLTESTALISTGAPLLLLCMARPELLDRRPGWPVALRLEPLPAEAAEALIGDAVPVHVRERIVRASGGNPLFVTEMLALASDGAEIEVPATLRALLAARLDQLDEPERRVLERGSVEGELFHHGAVQALAPEETEVTPRLAALVRKELVRPDRPQLPREDAYRFRHLLIRDTAYDALPKATRADLHRRFANWLQQHGQNLVELDEILGYHLEQAARYLEELGRTDPELAVAAGDRLVTAGRRAFWRGDHGGAVGLLARGLGLSRPHRLHMQAELELAHAIYWSDRPMALKIAEAAATQALANGDEAGAAAAQTFAAEMRMSGGDESAASVEQLARHALPLLEAAEDHDGLYAVWSSLAQVASLRGRYGDWAEAQEQALQHARRAGHMTAPVFPVAIPLLLGPRRASETLAALDGLLAEAPDSKALVFRAVMLAQLGRLDEAWGLAVPAEERARELGFAAGPRGYVAKIASLAGHDEVAAEYRRKANEVLEASDRMSELSTGLAEHGRVLCDLRRHEEAEALALRARELGDAEDTSTQQFSRQTQALVHSARGEHAAAERLAREAVDFSLRSDSPWHQGDAFFDLGQVLEALGRPEEAVVAFREALALYERKEIVPLARRVRERLASLQPA